MGRYNLSNLIKQNICFKKPQGTCIDLILTNCKFSLQHSHAVETDLSDFHLMPITMFKEGYESLPPQTIQYRDFSKFKGFNFNSELSHTIRLFQPKDYGQFELIFTNILQKYAPLKKRTIRGNDKSHVTKELRKQIMKRSRLKNISRKTKLPEDIQAYHKQRNLVVKLNKKQKKSYFESIDTTKEKSLWNMCKPYFTNKGCYQGKNVLAEKNGIVSDDQKIVNIFNKYFRDITSTLPIKHTGKNFSKFAEPVLEAINHFSNHSSIIKIKAESCNDNLQEIFQFRCVNNDEVRKIILSLNPRKSVSGDLPINILKLSVDIYLDFITNFINLSIQNNIFPNELKFADISPVFKKEDEMDKVNYRPISILPAVSKIFERVLFNQLNAFIEPKFSNLLCGFRKGHSTQHALLRLLKRWQACLDKNEIVGTILMDLSKAYDCLNHELLIAKLQAYGIGGPALLLIYDYLKKRKQRVKIGSIFSEWLEILSGVPQGSILGPLLFNIFINDIIKFVEQCDICNFADDNTIDSCGTTKNIVLDKLQNDLTILISWFESNYLVANPGKFQMMLLGKNIDNSTTSIKYKNFTINAKHSVILLGIIFDEELNFNKHVDEICSTVSRNTTALQWIRKYLNLEKALTLCNSYILCHFKYCPLIWMFSSRASNDEINRVHKRALRVAHSNFSLPYGVLLNRTNTVKIHIQNLQYLMVEVFKSIKGLSPSFMAEIFQTKKVVYKLRSTKLLTLPEATRYTFGIYGLSFRASLLWNQLPKKLKLHDIQTLAKFRTEIKRWKGCKCSCNICR